MSDEGTQVALRWGVKASFREYVQASGGTIEVSGGASQIDDEFIFPAASESMDAAMQYTGAVRFSAHAGAMTVLVQDPCIHDHGTETARLSIAGTEATRTAGGRLVLANLSGGEIRATSAGEQWAGVHARLSADGAVVFDFNYPVGVDLDPLSFSIGT